MFYAAQNVKIDYHVNAWPESFSACPVQPPPSLRYSPWVTYEHTLSPCPPVGLSVWGEGGWIATSSTQDWLSYVNGWEQGSATHIGPDAFSMKVECLQGALSSIEPLAHTNFKRRYQGPYTAAGGDCPLQLSFCSVYCYPPLWCARHFSAMGQRVK